MKEAERSAEIGRSADEVFAFLSEIDNLPRWQSGVISAEKTSDGPIGVGSTAVVERRVLGQQLRADLRVTVFEPPRRFVLEAESSGISVEASVAVEPLEAARCRVTFGMAMEATGFFMKAVEPMVAQAAEGDIEESLVRLKEALA